MFFDWIIDIATACDERGTRHDTTTDMSDGCCFLETHCILWERQQTTQVIASSPVLSNLSVAAGHFRHTPQGCGPHPSSHPLFHLVKNVTTWVQSTINHFTVAVLQESILTAFGSIFIRLCSGSLLCCEHELLLMRWLAPKKFEYS